ncbi:MAG: Spy/CpxP family protein refolding chaperone [Chloroherpetonaceae bacterium]
MKNLLALFSLLIIVTLSATGCGEKGQSPAEPLVEQNDARARFSDGILNLIESEVDLSASQKADFKKLTDDLASEMAARHGARKAEMEAFAIAFKNGTLADADLDKITPHFFPKERHAVMQSKLVQAHQLLTSEQRSKIADKLEARYTRMLEKREKWAEKRKDKPERHGWAGGGFMLKKLTRDLDLTDAQKATLMQIATTFQSKVGVEAVPTERAQMQAFIGEFRKDKMDEAVLNQGMAQLDAKQAEVRFAMKEAIRSVHAMLTPEQRAKASEKLLHMAERHAKFEGNPHGRGKHWGKHHQE